MSDHFIQQKAGVIEDAGLEEKCIEKEIIFAGRMLRMDRDTVRLPNGAETTREVVRHPGAVGILPFKGEELLLVRQYRYPIERITLEIPAGKLDPGEAPLACAERELREETGYGGTLEHLISIYTTPGFTDEVIHLYKATDLVWDPLQADEDEFLNVESVAWTKAKEMVLAGELRDAKTILGILLVLGKEQ
ncbi:NUDIX domain-containing protein [Desulfitobacterium chlororespirans]|uniref:ADP-ribose pyrophosphatase n=1 Tax=Desulfitobacterium chlororespirans DSM 11544 TaxID=1121395 RepID=A0A1M7U601_9FIRM|nr:NUDIX hydrolase [Desulfitobacterium chlororespirans]SHN78335.1 ADP-ribose pyrophosphatase [Desulfitobacterium chlororespirans DSM 11544]